MRIWPFRRSLRPLVQLDEDSLGRAIRAGVQFPLEWFLMQPPEVQETIALHRDRWLEDLTLAAAIANLDPERIRLHLAAQDGDEEAEAELTALTAVDIAEEMARHAAQGGPGGPQGGEPTTMAGLGRRRAEGAPGVSRTKPVGAMFGGEAKAR